MQSTELYIKDLTIMKTITKTLPLTTHNSLCVSSNLFFDIETTGFLRTGCFCYLIGAAYAANEHLTVIQWLAEEKDDEPKLLQTFAAFLSDFSSITHFNGDSFDIPFLKKRAEIYSIELNIDSLRSIDLYKQAKGLKPLMRLESYNQKSIEHFLGIHRDDLYSGKELIDVYKEYVKKLKKNEADSQSEELLLLHNYDDVCGLISISSITSYNNIIAKRISYDSLTYSPDYITLVFSLPEAVPVSILLQASDYVLRVEHSTLKVRFPLIIDSLKYFYDNYKDYYYLPYEDTAIHKSVAAYVDSECRKKATKDTCYTRKTAAFVMLPSYTGDRPVFKREYNDSDIFLMLDNASDSISDNTQLPAYDDYDTATIKKILPADIIQQAANAIITFFYKRTVHYTHNQDPYN